MQAAAAPRKEALLPLGLLVCDFDDTLTAKDTISVIFDTAVESRRQSSGANASLEVKQLANRLGEDYMKKYNAFMEPQLQKLGHSTAYNPSGVLSFLAELSAFDRDMVDVVEDSAVLRGIPSGALEAAGQERVPLKPDSKEVLQKAVRAGVATHVCSVNWSQAMVQGALREATAGVSQAGVAIHCNDLVEEDGRTTGKIIRRIECATDKAEVVHQLLSQKRSGCSVMCGDSLSDLQALLAVDFGIVIGSSGSLRRVLEAAGITLQPLSQAERIAVGPRGLLLHAQDWSEIDAFLFP